MDNSSFIHNTAEYTVPMVRNLLLLHQQAAISCFGILYLTLGLMLVQQVQVFLAYSNQVTRLRQTTMVGVAT